MYIRYFHRGLILLRDGCRWGRIEKRGLFQGPVNIFENEQVSFEGKVKSTVLSYAEKENMVCCENFFEVGNLCKQRDLGASVMHYVKYNYFGTPEEKEKGELIWKLYSKIKRYEQYAAWADGLDSKRYIEFVLSNNGTTYDEDIDVRVIVKKGLLCTRDDLPMPGSDIIGEITDNLEKFFIPDPAMNIDLYNSRKDRIIPPHLPISTLYYSSHDNSDEEHDKYSRELDYIFSYNVFSDNGFDVITFKQPYLKHNSNVFFPTRLYFNDIPDSINYEIRSKKFPEVIRNELRIPK